MKPLSPHWADIAATQVIRGRGDKDLYIVASGITPSGKVHVGNFREVITADLVARALRKRGKRVRFIYSWDNFDTFRKVPKNLPDPQQYEPYLREPIARIPDPWGKAENYAMGRIKLFENELNQVGIKPEYRYQEELYGKGCYADNIRTALENSKKIQQILNHYRSSPLDSSWLPISIYCRRCAKDNIAEQSYEGGWSCYYRCGSCGFEESFDIRDSSGIKLTWRIDWPMRWAFEGVDFEPGGKDHSSQGGSFDTGKAVIREIWNQEPPVYLQYDFVMIKGGAGKMSSSSGELYTLDEVLRVYEPQVVRWIFANHRPNHDFAIAFDEDVIKIYDEFDRSEQMAFSPCPEEKPGKWPLNRRTWELSLPEEDPPPDTRPVRASFRVLCNRLQICGGDIDRTFRRYYSESISSEGDCKRFWSRAERAINWLRGFASDEFRYELNCSAVDKDLSADQTKAIRALRGLIQQIDLCQISPKELNELIWDRAIRGVGCEPAEVFRAIYQKLINRSQGPRLPGFLKEIGQEKLLELLL